ncbi:MAG: arginine deiminase family protein [Gammaproteobacteria bacterium]|nr:arginine deiminase family protein [Gammaproteobacteria bacterium]
MMPDGNRQSDTGHLRRVIVKHVRDAFVDARQVADQWRRLNYADPPNLQAAQTEYDTFTTALRETGAQLVFLPRDDQTGLDSIYPRDAAVICNNGAILCSMGKDARRGEPGALRGTLAKLEIPVYGEISGTGLLEGGDVVWLGPRLVAVGLGYRTNQEGIDQLQEFLRGLIDELFVVALPHWHGPNDVFHLMSMISPLDTDLAAVYSPLLPVSFRQRLISLGFELVEIPDDEFESQACNILALAPRNVLMLDGNPQTRSRLEAAGVQVQVYRGNEISLKGGGGPTCLTRPLERY